RGLDREIAFRFSGVARQRRPHRTDPLANYSPTTGRLPVILAYSLATARALSFAQYLERLVGTLRFQSPFPPARAPPLGPGGRSSVALQSRAPANLSDFLEKLDLKGTWQPA